jgi:uncharacterized repeat protein (TIGR04138 family)
MAKSEHPSIRDILRKQVALHEAIAEDPRYPIDAYLFVCEGVDHTCENLGGRRDVTGRELIDGLCDLAVGRFGYLAPAVLERWGIQRTDDFGEIVFTLVGVGLLGKSPHDSKADFHNVLDLRKTLHERYRIDPEI